MLLFVGTPNKESRILRLQEKLRSSRLLSTSTRDKVTSLVDTFLTEQWGEMKFLTYAENEMFLAGVVELAVRTILL